jgi:CPA1 family monovalent cation:H+ antiporter
MKKLNIRDNNPLEEAHEADLAIYYLLQEKSQLDHYKTKGFLSQEQYDVSAAKVANKLKEAETQRQYLIEKHGIAVFKQSLHLAMVHVEKKAVKRLFINEEVSEKTFRRIYSKLGGRLDKIEELKEDAHLINTYKDRKDIFEHLVNFVQMPFDRQRELSHQQKLEYYRAQMIMARKAIKTIEQMQTEFDHPVFLPEAYDEVISLYRRYKDRSGTKAEDLVALFKDELSPYLENLANRSLAASGTRALAYLHENGLADEHMQESIRERWAV